MISFDIGGLVVYTGLVAFATYALINRHELFEYKKGDIKFDIKKWFKDDFFGTK